jgi:hypothetical protein
VLDNVYLGTNNAVRLTVGEAHEARHGKQDGGVGESMQVAAPGIDDVHPSSASCVRAATRKQGAGARRSGESRTAAPTPVWFCTPRRARTEDQRVISDASPGESRASAGESRFPIRLSGRPDDGPRGNRVSEPPRQAGVLATTRPIAPLLPRRRDDSHFSQAGFRALSARRHRTTEGRLSPSGSLEGGAGRLIAPHLPPGL